MNNLPQELHDRIAYWLEAAATRKDGRSTRVMSTLATVSRAWQSAVERRTFRTLSLDSLQLVQTRKIVTGPRREYLRTINYIIVLLVYPEADHLRMESQTDRDINNIAFTEAIRGLFGIIKSWEDQDGDSRHARLRLNIGAPISPSDDEFANQLNAQKPVPGIGKLRRFRFSYICLVDPDQLPSLQTVREVCWPWAWNLRRIAFKTWMQITSKLPNVKGLSSTFGDDEDAYPAMRRLQRDNFAQSLRQYAFAESIETLAIRMMPGRMLNQLWRPMSLLQQGTSHDPVSSALWHATRYKGKLRHLCLTGVIDFSALWPLHVPGPVEPFWQNLTGLHIHFGKVTPCGHWYFHGTPDNPEIESRIQVRARSEVIMPPGYAATPEEEDQTFPKSWKHDVKDRGNHPVLSFRLDPDEELMNPLIEAFARACSQIPKLREACMDTELEHPTVINGVPNPPTMIRWGIYFAVANQPSVWKLRPGTEEHFPEEQLSRPRLSFVNTTSWRPNEDLMALLRGIAHSNDLVEQDVNLSKMIQNS